MQGPRLNVVSFLQSQESRLQRIVTAWANWPTKMPLQERTSWLMNRSCDDFSFPGSPSKDPCSEKRCFGPNSKRSVQSCFETLAIFPFAGRLMYICYLKECVQKTSLIIIDSFTSRLLVRLGLSHSYPDSERLTTSRTTNLLIAREESPDAIPRIASADQRISDALIGRSSRIPQIRVALAEPGHLCLTNQSCKLVPI